MLLALLSITVNGHVVVVVAVAAVVAAVDAVVVAVADHKKNS